MDPTTLDRFSKLSQRDKIFATYIWVDTMEGEQMRGKLKVLHSVPTDVSKLPRWDTATPAAMDSHDIIEHYLEPVAMYPDPFLGEPNILVLCEVFQKGGIPAKTNHRLACRAVMEKAAKSDPWFGIEQEYILTTADTEPLGWPHRGLPVQGIGPSHSGAGASRVVGRAVADSHLRACVYAGLTVDGTNAEAVPAQWEYQIGPSRGIEAADHTWVSRYLLQRVAEEFGLDFTMDAKPVLQADPSFTTGAHCNFSTNETRDPINGLSIMKEMCQRLEKQHLKHIKQYDLRGENEKRLTKSMLETFTWGVGTRDTSVRIPGRCAEVGYGYLEDRRPAGNADPYVVTRLVVQTALLNETD